MDALAEGAVFVGANAAQNGLVDELGGVRDAARWVASEAGVEVGELSFL